MVQYLDSHAVSAEYSYWRLDEAEVRSFLVATNRGMGAWLDAKWTEAKDRAEAIFDPDMHDGGLVAELFEDAVGVWPSDYFWQLSSAVIKDACALYEVFLERMANAVLHRHGGRLTNLDSEDSWKWRECRLFYQNYIGIDVTPPAIESILWVRNKLTHLRDELRTPAGLAEFQTRLATLNVHHLRTPEEVALGLVSHQPYAAKGVALSQLETLRILDLLADQVASVALAAFKYDYGGATNCFLDAIRAKSPRALNGFPTARLIAV